MRGAGNFRTAAGSCRGIILYAMLTLKQWLEKHGQEPCDDCEFFNIQRCHCSYKRGYCVRYDDYRQVERQKSRYPDLFEDQDPVEAH